MGRENTIGYGGWGEGEGFGRCIFPCDHASAIGNPAAQSLEYIMFRSKRISEQLQCVRSI